jgi:hypothetical protein
MRRNSPTIENPVMTKATWRGNVSGCADWSTDLLRPAGADAHSHSLFGWLTPEEWAVLMYKHMDHHLQQFGV